MIRKVKKRNCFLRMMNELLKFLAKNHDKLTKADRQGLIEITNQIEALKKEKEDEKKSAAKQAIGMILDGLARIADTTHYSNDGYKGPYTKLENRIILRTAVGMARKMLREE